MQPAVSLLHGALNSWNVKELIKEQIANRKLYSPLSHILGEKKKKNHYEIAMHKKRKIYFPNVWVGAGGGGEAM